MQLLNNQKKVNKTGIIGLISSIFVGIPLMALPASSQIIIGPICPGLYYEEPWNDIIEPPAGCPANEREIYSSQAELDDREPDYDDVEVYDPEPDYLEPNYRVVPPLPEVLNDPIAFVNPTNDGTVDIKIDNDTNSLVTYQVLGHTDERWLEGREEIMLTDVPTPVTITMIREDNGLLEFMTSGSDSDYLHVTLNEDPTFDDVQGVLRIQPSGEVFLQ
ncbi:hypothetical protein [Crocosphaera chwakensis]|uniref:Uncharacterized protein n=1 Tax=Crocosphaera chwakensis CCY0110 TaxID=391612 RepID=A3J020_9CHRO|nr:hypothetical protein [Crocosphaera chwakensis]EAZ87927.1 hypothetical protein CY0110_22941 [Crocosphaera chwakensis CCY0110]